jgi:hypothetical protein
MSYETPQPAEPQKRRIGFKVALVSAGVVAGVIGATALGASADTPSGTTDGSGSTSSSTGAGTASGTAPTGQPGPGGSNPARGDEKSVGASLEAKLKATALKAVPGGSVVRVETDAGDAAYEVHMTKSDGSLVTVKFDKNATVTAVEGGMGKGDPAPAGDRGHDGPPNR